MTPEEKKAFDEQLAGLKKDLQEAATKEIKSQIEAAIKSLEEKGKSVAEVTKKEMDDLTAAVKVIKDAADKNQPIIDEAVANKSKRTTEPGKILTLEQAFHKAFSDNIDAVKDFVKSRAKDAKLNIQIPGVKKEEFNGEVKTVGDMTQSANITGDVVQSYNNRQGLIPAQKVNFRDLIPVTFSPTGVYVTYREGAGEGSVTQQTEGSAKTQVDSDFTNVQLVEKYTAAFQRFTKQLMYNLPWLQGTLTRILLRKFYAKENALFYAKISATTGSTGSHTTSGGNIVEKIIDLIANQRTASFNASFVLITFADWAALLKTAYPSTGTSYSLPAGASFTPDGVLRVAGVPVIPAEFVTASDIQIIDADYIERVETEALNIAFSYEDSNNFTENKITARIECFEELNILRTDAHINYGTAS
jgi:HK97 family phage major capsid protein